jgi:hypothetical protein
MAVFPIGLSAKGILPLVVGALAVGHNVWTGRKATAPAGP